MPVGSRSIESYFPELKEDVIEPLLLRDLEVALFNVWMSDGRTLGKLHFDPYDNLLCQVRAWLFVPAA